jgi:hypothetical protein
MLRNHRLSPQVDQDHLETGGSSQPIGVMSSDIYNRALCEPSARYRRNGSSVRPAPSQGRFRSTASRWSAEPFAGTVAA